MIENDLVLHIEHSKVGIVTLFHATAVTWSTLSWDMLVLGDSNYPK